MSYGYQDGDLATVSKRSGATTTFVYDDRRRVTAWIDSNGSRYDYVYDRDRVVTEGGEAGHVQITLTYTEPDPETGHRTTTLTTADGCGPVAKGMVKYEMHPSFLEEFGQHAKVHDTKGPNGAVRLEFEIPVEKLDRFNELTQGRSWVSIFGGLK